MARKTLRRIPLAPAAVLLLLMAPPALRAGPPLPGWMPLPPPSGASQAGQGQSQPPAGGSQSSPNQSQPPAGASQSSPNQAQTPQGQPQAPPGKTPPGKEEPPPPPPIKPVLLTAPAGPTPDVGPLIEKAERALDRKDFQAALDPLKTATQTDPQNVSGWFDLAYAYSGLRQNDAARQAYEKTVAINPNLFEAQFNLGVLLTEMHSEHAAEPHLQAAAKLRPGDARPHLFLGRALAAEGDSAGAVTEFRRALQLDAKQAPAAYEIGQLEYNQKQFAAAATDFEKALEINPALAEAALGVASAHEAQGQPEEAEQGLKQYLQLRPADATARYHLARLYLQQKQFDAALEELQRLQRSQAAIPGLDATLGDAYALAGKFAQSEPLYRKALAAAPSGPGSADLHRALAETLLKEGKTAAAESEFRQALQLEAKNTDAMKGLATSLYLEKRYAEAAPIIEQLVRAPSASPGLYFILATCYDNLRDLPRALQAYQDFLARSHGSSPDQEWQARQRAKLLSHELRKPL